MTQQEIEIVNLKGEVVVLRHLVQMLVEHAMPFDPSTSAAIRVAADRARSENPDLSPARISVDHALNRWLPWNWMRRHA